MESGDTCGSEASLLNNSNLWVSLDNPSSSSESSSSQRSCFNNRIKKESLVLFLCVSCLFITSCLNSIFFKKMTNAMPNYCWFLSQLTCFLYVPLFGIIVALSTLSGNITDKMRNFPLYKFAVMGIFDSLLGLLSIIGGAFTSGPAQLVLSQLVIPVTLMLSTFFLKHSYHFLQYAGALIVVAGAVASQSDHILQRNIEAHNTNKTPDIFLFNVIFTCGVLPNALSQIYKEKAFRKLDIEVNYMQFWVAVFQFLFGLLIVPVNSFPFLGAQQIPLSYIPKMLLGGFKCLFFSENSLTINCGGVDQPPCDDCTNAWISVVCYMFFNVLYNVFILLVVKYGSATLSFIILTLRLPVTTFAFYSTFIMGNDVVKPKLEDLFGLIILLIGLSFYKIGSELNLSKIHAGDAATEVEFEEEHLQQQLLAPLN